MTVDDEKQQYLDFVEFCLADYTDEDDEEKTRTESSEIKTNEQINLINKRKWPKSRIVNFNILNIFKQECKPIYSQMQEYLLLFKIQNVNKCTTYLPLSKFFGRTDEYFLHNYAAGVKTFNFTQLGTRKKLCVDMKTLRALERNKIINCLSIFNSLYPIKTLGDGNCLVRKIFMIK
jgi:hypothetical protein